MVKSEMIKTVVLSLGLWLILMLWACSENPTPRYTQTEAETEAALTPVTNNDTAFHPLFLEMRDAAMRWNQAMDLHQPEDLTAMYAEEVLFFADTLSRDSLMQLKRGGFAKMPTYRQSCWYRTATCPGGPFPPKEVQVELRIQEFRPEDTLVGSGYLVFAEQAGQWKIVEESEWNTRNEWESQLPGQQLASGTYCLEWQQYFDPRERMGEMLVGERKIKCQFTLTDNRITNGTLSGYDHRRMLQTTWKITGGSQPFPGELKLDLLRQEEGDGPPIDPQWIRLKTYDGNHFLILNSDTQLEPNARLEKVTCN